jgi:hypothetical protein
MSSVSSMIQGLAAMEKHISLPLRKLTKRVTGSGKDPKTPPKSPSPKMAEQEEDFSSLPLPDRFQHKVLIKRQSQNVSGEGLTILSLDMESTKARIRRRCKAIRNYA